MGLKFTIYEFYSESYVKKVLSVLWDINRDENDLVVPTFSTNIYQWEKKCFKTINNVIQ